MRPSERKKALLSGDSPKPGGGELRPHGDDSGARNEKQRITGDVHVRGEVVFEAGPEEKLTRKAAEIKQDSKDREKKWLERITLIVLVVYTFVASLQWKASMQQANYAQDANRLLEQQLLPFVVMQKMDLDSAIVVGAATKIANNFVNEGATPAFEVHLLSRVDILPSGKSPERQYRVISGSTGTVGSKSNFNSTIFIRPLTAEQLAAVQNGISRIYVSGVVVYSDFSHKEHHTPFCVFYDPHTTLMIGCPNQMAAD